MLSGLWITLLVVVDIVLVATGAERGPGGEIGEPATCRPTISGPATHRAGPGAIQIHTQRPPSPAHDRTVPVLLGGGTPFFDGVAGGPVAFDGPISLERGKAVTHLRYRVSR